MLTLLLRSVVLSFVPFVLPLAAQEPSEEEPAPAPVTWMGREGPELITRNWINLAPGEAPPTLEGLRGKVVLLEFWATVKKACGKGLPHAQKYHERLTPHGLEVLALSYDPGQELEVQVRAYGITVRLGTEGTMADFQSYDVPSVPYAVVVGPDGRVMYRGTPEMAEPVLLRALGLDPEPRSVLASVAHSADAQEFRARLEWLIDCAPRAFDLAGFAAEQAGIEPTDATATSGVDADAALAAWMEALANGTDGAQELATLAASGARAFDLRRFTWAQLARIAPLERQEFDQLVEARELQTALDALMFRAASPELLQHAAGVHAFTEHCKTATREARAMAKKALLAELWYLAGIEPRSRTAYWVELGLGGDPDKKAEHEAPTLIIGFERLDRAAAVAYFDEAMLRHLVSAQYASGLVPDLAALRARVPKERERELRTAISKHGQPVDR